MPEVKLSMTARERLLAKFEDAGQEHEFRTTPIACSAQLEGTVVDADLTNGVAYLVFQPQKIKFFRTGEGDSIQFGAIRTDATDVDTNLQKGGSTDGARDMAIEGISVATQGTIVKYFDEGAALTGFGTAPVNEDVKAALYGEGVICDPFGVLTPPQVQSPYLLEEAIFQQVLKLSTLELMLDTSRSFKLGCADLCPGSAGSSMLRANGNPEAGNYYRFPEGIEWHADGKADSDMKVEFALQRKIVVPLSLVTFPGGAAKTAPKKLYLRVSMRLHGMSVSALGNN